MRDQTQGSEPESVSGEMTGVMKHIDNLIARGDELFRRETRESINEATLLYITAAEILGQRPQALPANDALQGYRNTIANRLLNIRHCRNIEGIDLQPPIFEPPIDPALLVRAAAAGIDIGIPISDSHAGMTGHLNQNEREFEITTRVSLALHDPLALSALKTAGHCEVELTESVFDADYPGHYMRRLKNVSLTVPCVVGPYTSISCTLTLLSNKTRVKSTGADSYPERQDGDDDRFVTNVAALQAIATSHEQHDRGMFELNFGDERYLPFEGAGAVSRWTIGMPRDCNTFDFETISDVIISLRYTARDGGDPLRRAAQQAGSGIDR
jgi:hypothetical protein